MLFNSIEYAFFFPIVTILFFVLPHRFRWLLLLMASCVFYMFFKPLYIFILVFTIVIDYFAGIWIAREQDRTRKKYLLLLSIIANVGVLIVFKYYNFLAGNLNIVLSAFQQGKPIPTLNILLPIGLSFHTFQAMSYTIEVYRGNQQPEKHFGIYALYVMFYPQLVAGPIERPQHIIHQFYEVKRFNYDNMRRGLILIAWGLFKKVVIADRLAFFVNQVYANPTSYSGLPLIISTVFFSFQIFCDFSGYSDIAVGSALCMGYDLMQNFERPYMSTSMAEFWRRWHISLSTWFRDYVYIPLGGSRTLRVRWYFNIMVVFILSGIWHGANWTFVIWGMLHGFYLIVESKVTWLSTTGTGMLNYLMKRIWVFGVATFAWVFFRAHSLSDAFYIVSHALTNIPRQIHIVMTNEHLLRLRELYIEQPGSEFYLAILFILVMSTVHFMQKKLRFDEWLISKSRYVRWSMYYGLVLSFICFGIFNRSEFIYFQF